MIFVAKLSDWPAFCLDAFHVTFLLGAAWGDAQIEERLAPVLWTHLNEHKYARIRPNRLWHTRWCIFIGCIQGKRLHLDLLPACCWKRAEQIVPSYQEQEHNTLIDSRHQASDYYYCLNVCIHSASKSAWRRSNPQLRALLLNWRPFLR